MYIFDIQMAEVKYSIRNKTYVLKEDDYQRYNEYLMTLFHTYIVENDEGIKTAGIDQFFYNYIGNIVTYETAKVRYLNSSQEFIFSTTYDDNNNRNDYYKLIATGERFQLTFVKTEYNPE
jgi:hypothetical protein